MTRKQLFVIYTSPEQFTAAYLSVSLLSHDVDILGKGVQTDLRALVCCCDTDLTDTVIEYLSRQKSIGDFRLGDVFDVDLVTDDHHCGHGG